MTARTRRAQKSALTRAQRSGDPHKVIAECRRTVTVDWADCPWPDDWHRWNVALSDASYAIAREAGSWADLPQHLDDL